ncbi:acyl-CoA synthetase FdrA [Caldinitratiruptor microaerophilus]|uniref:Uncharacterized protein n=1 Tax=Caldinitratiruptor microaerophilus TaxID=671077 RepID=A0AA35CKG9_9FIRM|nr:acyl-CoA synthetase FdrA [Caldinitratiruptor microaerophilus]BDG60787.1 hypothetical protein caldi_18770 [Caldinitratiruptor microaerophilus]
MPVQTVVKPNTYHDSVALMSISQKLMELPGVREAVVAMATEMNKEILEQVGLLTDSARAARETDLVIAVDAETDEALAAALEQAEVLLRKGSGGGDRGSGGALPRTLTAALSQAPGANLAFISVPGAYAGREARKALEHGLHVMLYSDNVPLETEVALKRLAHEKGLLLMGPDCGTAIVGGVGLGFANAVRRGPIGIVAASGTGSQELSVLIDRLGSGISHLLGTGGRDLTAEVGGLMMRDGLRLLAEDPETAVIVVLSKPPAPAVAQRLAADIGAISKPVVTCFLGGEGALSIDEAAVQAVSLATGRPVAELEAQIGYGGPLPALPVRPGRRYVRGLFSGGSLCDQALAVLEARVGPVLCNVHPVAERRGGVDRSRGHTLLDLGDDTFTVGRAHPMIDPTVRRQRLRAEAADPETAVILLDIVAGHGAHPDPAGALADEIAAAVAGGVAVVASVTATEADPQRRSEQEERLRAAGAVVLPTARLAALTVAASLEGR